MTPSIVLIAVFFYIILLFGLARLGDRQHFVENSWARHPVVYALALGVYCTSWTFYGLVGTASEKGWNFLPILLGPMLLFTIGYPVLERIRRICKQEHIHSIADFIASRYGKRQGVAATVSLVALLATIPYIALQLKAVSDTLVLTIGENFLVNQDLTFVIALSMIVFALLFGAKRLDVSGYHSGLMSAVAFESIIKLIVLLTIAFFALSWLIGDTSSVDEQTANVVLLAPPSGLRFFVETLLSMCAIFCLPRMFHVTFVECLSSDHLKKSRWFFVGYLILISLCVLVIAWIGNVLFFGDPSIKGDAYVIALPLLKDLPWLALVAFLGGFSAATAMIIVATVTLSQMLSNDVILPVLVKRRKTLNQSSDFTRSLIIARRLTVLLVVMGAYAYQAVLAENAALTSIGLIAFALVVQLAPAILFGLYWRKGNARGLYAGLIVGLALWFYTLMIPLLEQAGLIGSELVMNGLFNLYWLRPESLFGLSFSDSFTRGVILSLGANILFYCWYSMTSPENLGDRIQAAAFTRMQKTDYNPYEDINLDDLYSLLREFLGETATRSLFSKYQTSNNYKKTDLIEQARKTLAGTVGVASSQSMLDSLRIGEKMAVEEVVNLFGETTKALRFNQEVLSASFENISSGISVVDENLRLIAWNNHYEKMFDYPEGMLNVGLHVADIMRFNGGRGLLGEGNVDDLIRKRLSLMSTGNAYRVVRFHSDDTIIEIKGRPLPNGGYVTTYDDITEFISAQRQLEDANINLEKRVQERTKTIEEINQNLLQEIKRRGYVEDELREAKIIADAANASKTKFLALAGHDIMQPLNAASLYASALTESESNKPIVHQLKSAIDNTESIISSLLEISKLDTGALKPKLEIFSLDDLLASLISEAMVQRPRGLDIHYCSTSLYVLSDKHYLRRIIQNFISNAVKYTHSGKVLVGCRHHYQKGNGEGNNAVEICVLDNGPGISAKERASIFDEFYRSNRQQQQDKVPGIGLGLSVVMRFSELLSHPIKCSSELHKGSCFSVTVPMANNDKQVDNTPDLYSPENELKGLRVVYLDDDKQNLLATSTLLDHWQCNVTLLNSIDDAREYAKYQDAPDVLLMDYQLGDLKLNGLLLAQELKAHWLGNATERVQLEVCIVSASTDAGLPEAVAGVGFEFLRKPVKPAKLRALLTQFCQRKGLTES
ncbi:MAG: PAS domain-containing hybrid sensor histidine kinase/response regulator [Cellvibrionaceae bacterium]